MIEKSRRAVCVGLPETDAVSATGDGQECREGGMRSGSPGTSIRRQCVRKSAERAARRCPARGRKKHGTRFPKRLPDMAQNSELARGRPGRRSLGPPLAEEATG